jgi:hypothetical protein
MNQSSICMLIFAQAVLGLINSTQGDIPISYGTKLKVSKIYH